MKRRIKNMMNDVRNITAIIDFSKKENKIVLVIVDKTQYIEADLAAP